MQGQRTCSIPDCGKAHIARGYCGMHYKHWQLYGDPLAGPFQRQSPGSCGADGCGERAWPCGLCPRHYYAQYRTAHRAKARATTARYRADNPERVRAAMARWMADSENRRVFRQHQRRYRAQKKSTAVGTIAPPLLDGKLAYWGWRCHLAGPGCTVVPEHWDHVKPLVKGGLHCLANLRPACGVCNRRKSARHPYPIRYHPFKEAA